MKSTHQSNLSLLRVLAACLLTFAPLSGIAAAETPDCMPFVTTASIETEHFIIGYSTAGDHAPAWDDGAHPVTRMDGVQIGMTTAGNGVASYVDQAAISLEYAYEQYLAAGFRLPARQEVYIRDDLGANGLYLPTCDEIYLVPDLVTLNSVAAHELFHAVQYEYWEFADFDGLPPVEEAFYKEGSAEAASVAVMRPVPFVTWFDDPDQAPLFEIGHFSFFFWIYYGERLVQGDPPIADLLPSLPGLARYFDVVAGPEFGLSEALDEAAAQAGWFFDGILEGMTIANATLGPLSAVDPLDDPAVAPYTYVYEHVRGFYQPVEPEPIGLEEFTLDRRTAQLTLGEWIEHKGGAVYREMPAELLDRESVLSVSMTSIAATPGPAFVIVMAVEGDEVRRLTLRRLEHGDRRLLHLQPDPALRVLFIGFNENDGEWGFSLDIRLRQM